MRLFYILLLFSITANGNDSFGDFQDITKNGLDSDVELDSEDDDLFTTTEPLPSTLMTAQLFARRRSHSPTATAAPIGYGALTSKKPSTTTVSRDDGQSRQVIAGIPDMSDPCFRRYTNCIVVNAQPYERRSSTSLVKCKQHCLNSQSGVYSCRAFVFDNVNQVCDLFAHVGDQAPARLLKFQTRDYFEPTMAASCISGESVPEVAAQATSIDVRKDNKIETPDLVDQKPSRDEPFGRQCPTGKRAAFLRTDGFELFGNDDVAQSASDVAECTSACEANRIGERKLDCRSFDFDDKMCRFTTEAAVPVGGGQLKQKNGAAYYEKICVNDRLSQGCPLSFGRFPQMILVGFAESVSDSPTFEHCFDSCLDSMQLFGFNCTSGMFYFEEQQLNCILNSENRHTQSDLFSEENTDIVDYFEVGCDVTRARAAAAKTLKDSTIINTDKLVLATETETDWSTCEDGVQHRRRSCSDGACGLESRACNSTIATTTISTGTSGRSNLPSSAEVIALKARLQKEGFRCPKDECCKVFSTCNVGLRLSSTSKKLEWCRSPCKKTHKTKLRARKRRFNPNHQ